ncbi:AAA family ATPase [Priestia aryabhattai]|uniref:AAA family ATPase n=1 Tax=Priestia aryabhattai TaxID=412384 RepID=UPI001C0ACCFF|nr:AAA family ATPase [Priestia aryabhattai]MBU3568662.1 AAA family ATPase [Priestia aryabhattai]
MLKNVSVEGLFGYLTYGLNFSKLQSNVALIHGPNGSGKTTVFKMIEAISKEEFEIFFKTPFTKFTIQTDYSLLVVEKVDDNQIIFNNDYILNRNDFEKFDKMDLDEVNRFLHGCGAIRLGPRSYEYEGKRYRHTELLELLKQEDTQEDVYPEYISSLANEINILYIGSERLIKKEERKVVENRKKLKEIVQMYENRYAIISKELDARFPKRIITEGRNILGTIDSEDIAFRLQQLSKKRIQLTKRGILSNDNSNELIPADEIKSDDISDNQYMKQYLNFYIEDNEKKLNEFNDLLEKIDAFETIINGYFVNKKILFSKNEGYTITLTRGLLKGQEIPLDRLSSGEQHFLVLFFELIFNSESNQIVLIDEPEISLHVSWQINMVDGLITIANLGDHQFVLATHSPQILRNHRGKVLTVGYEDE